MGTPALTNNPPSEDNGCQNSNSLILSLGEVTNSPFSDASYAVITGNGRGFSIDTRYDLR